MMVQLGNVYALGLSCVDLQKSAFSWIHVRASPSPHSRAWRPRKEQEQDVPNLKERKNALQRLFRGGGLFPMTQSSTSWSAGVLYTNWFCGIEKRQVRLRPWGRSDVRSHVHRAAITRDPIYHVCEIWWSNPLPWHDLSDLWPCSWMEVWPFP